MCRRGIDIRKVKQNCIIVKWSEESVKMNETTLFSKHVDLKGLIENDEKVSYDSFASTLNTSKVRYQLKHLEKMIKLD